LLWNDYLWGDSDEINYVGAVVVNFFRVGADRRPLIDANISFTAFLVQSSFPAVSAVGVSLEKIFQQMHFSPVFPLSLFTITDGHFFKLFDVFRESQFSKSGFA